MGLLPANATALERALGEVITGLLDGVSIPVRTLRTVATCPEEWLPYLAWERGLDAWSDEWPIYVKRAAVAGSFMLHAAKGTVAADRQVLDGAGAIYAYAEGAGASHHTVAIKVRNAGTLTLSAAEIERAIDRVKRASVHYAIAHEVGFCAPLWLAGGFGAMAHMDPRFEGGL